MNARITRKSFVLLAVALVMVLVLAGTVLAAEQTERPVFWSWDVGGTPVGASNLVRNDTGISASFKTTGLTPGNAVTLWFVVFNNPGECSAPGCGPDDMGDTPAQGDCLYAGGPVIGGDGQGNFGGHLNVGDTSRSGLAELMGGCENCTPGLINPEGALVTLAVHDHGPARTGQALTEQISTFMGDCDPYPPSPVIGDANGFATGPGDLPIPAGGYCLTTQFSPHMPQ